MDKLQKKKEALKEYLKRLESVAVAFSGGVDSVFLMKMAQEALGSRAVAVTVNLYSFPEREKQEAEAFCAKEGILQLTVNFDELQLEGFRENPANRCYLCKYALMSSIKEAAEQINVKYVCEGSNLDDGKDYRPGMQAVKELGILSPLKEIGFTKDEIRQLSKEMGLRQWNKPSFACLASRIPYGESITAEKLKMVEKAEQYLWEQGFTQFRVRMHQDMARIEVLPQEFNRFAEKNIRTEVYQYLKNLGFRYVALDLEGYRTGSMNSNIEIK